jgi:hypothetical protein
VCRYEAHVTRGNADEGGHVDVAPDGGGVPWSVVPYTGRTRTTKKGDALVFDDTSACRTYLSMSFGSYSGLEMHEFVHQNLKESIIAPKTVSSGKAKQ